MVLIQGCCGDAGEGAPGRQGVDASMGGASRLCGFRGWENMFDAAVRPSLVATNAFVPAPGAERMSTCSGWAWGRRPSTAQRRTRTSTPRNSRRICRRTWDRGI
eukprot:7264092-Alexandrium_andersonii.AAC.1